MIAVIHPPAAEQVADALHSIVSDDLRAGRPIERRTKPSDISGA